MPAIHPAAPPAVVPGGVDDALETLYALAAKQSSTDLQLGQTEAEGEKKIRDALYKEQKDALAREAKAEGEGSKGLLGSVEGFVGDVAGDVASGHFADAV